MEVETRLKSKKISMVRTFWRTNALMLLFLIALYNFKLFIQYFSSFSLAEVMTHVRSEDLYSQGLLLDLSQFIFIVIVLHILWSLIITFSCKPWFRLVAHEGIRTQIWLVIVLLHLTIVLAANAYFYPTSLLGFLRGTPLASSLGLTLASMLLVSQLIWAIYSDFGPKVMTFTLLFAAMSIAIMSYSPERAYALNDKNNPNVFIIGIDGLRPDHLEYRNSENKFTPHIDEFISKSHVFTNTYSPLGRTYVAWMSILSGLYPKSHGARFNLAPPELINKDIPLVRELSARGYKTTYAIDERRFNQIDKAYGFDEIVGPKVGAADAIISSMADFPLINLFSNIPTASTLFPYLYMNRGYGKGYSPIHFNQEVLASLSTERPNFLAVHFCQLHWPYTSKDFIDVNKAHWDGNYNHFMYQALLSKVDDQVNALLTDLHERGFLNNAIVYLISDHGEGFMLKKDVITSKSVREETKLHPNAWGHGTNVMSQEQTNVLMAYRRFSSSLDNQTPQQIEGTFSLVDIAPSLFNELNLALQAKDKPFDGTALTNSTQNTSERTVFVESSVPFRSINASFIDEKKVMSETASNYEVRENGRAVLIPSIYKEMVAKKQRSVYYKHWQLAFIPDYEELILIDTDNKEWQSLSEYTGEAPWKKMLASICDHYEGDPGFDPLKACQRVTPISN
ncbi:sulfatase-like hydrolase/transferase [Shewanella psychropiezotolerans]|uniref:Sulfatase-like hydrolase/transferase n=1 Tax=Shewanella psychropiezotolerans TaxID=2593655 RepID=A0ABX5WXY9_9GAMM|nr:MULTISPECIES: sulfatase-like hydrolase/transferase [Shewanella]MPY24613.1 sulfatase-like hydrolase/transferase [Shewanella sp. YLB-07]QDO83964.1 sulfatase-like hydrolase/transferase [Shewanella psychropiezotolerans]